ncbi:hypothetical protein ACFST9_14055 [Hymenobacter monticola]|uniref:Uncharacterized protein n=2 Tax=Hymenobacter TaxID=89966 RepID=A0ABY4BBQ9_9BACT|nr:MULTISPECIES: hypothetical protein [Hymenobacter]MDU0372312.1 hypothetical protein [Hymenobacter endophyticus]UOE36590.1 hypothetical protein MTP16_24170 [Hymenobacter monticola]
MKDDELQFLQEQLEATELLPCATCRQETLHAHVEVLERYAYATELLMECTACGTRRTWMQLETPQ